ncbi:hypothetical protein JHK85_006964 [Glycine max]|uniref:Uncharacterized protein n=1 Tax=Glycine max TaxID=3847 RepID=A0A0R0KG51_SOYBN|nr:hypothetical protein JHK87_006616 [Glycine soja]KAG5054454.1 hypothetical protein JHK85_006964 [Glycine max]KAG5071555.1 hypothetical protein JHK86_006766 [Glycine max]KAH1069047.1 hypothetical protein GYH30_006580 [Glycine max]
MMFNVKVQSNPHKPTQEYSACFFLTHMLFEKTSKKITHPITTQSQTCLIVELLSDGLQKSRCILLV